MTCSAAGTTWASLSWLSRDEVLERAPALTGDGLAGAVRYYDGFTNDARLTLDTLRSAAASGAVVLSYCRFNEAARQDLWECEVQDAPTGQKRIVQARTVVNATGPWADALPHSRVKLRATKGIHLVVRRERLPVPDSIVMTQGKRILFAIPWGQRTILGTTDTDYSGPVEDVRAEASDISYVLGGRQPLLPQGPPRRRGRPERLGRASAADSRSRRRAFGGLTLARDPQPRAGLVGCGGRQAHHLPAHGRADGRPYR